MVISTWALPAPALVALDDRLAALKPRLYIESGSGESTLVAARHAERVISLEHDASWVDHVYRRFDEEGIPRAHVEVRHAEIGMVGTPIGPAPWYDTTLDVEADFALIDGPPCRIGRLAAGFVFLPLVSGEVWVDDYQHMTRHPCKTRAWVAAWLEHNPGWRVAETQSFDMVSLGRGGRPYRDKDRIAILR